MNATNCVALRRHFKFVSLKNLGFVLLRSSNFSSKQRINMLEGYSPVWQAFFGTLFTWFLTAAGAALVFFLNGTQRKFLDSSLGFAAGVMLAASYWSLLAPAIEMVENSGLYGNSGEYACLPIAAGIFFGAFFVHLADLMLQYFNIGTSISPESTPIEEPRFSLGLKSESSQILGSDGDLFTLKKRTKTTATENEIDQTESGLFNKEFVDEKKQSGNWKRICLLIIAITVHNIPEGLAVGVGFGAIGKSPKATLQSARNLAIGIGIQNFPEGLAVSLPLRGSGFSVWQSFWYGQLSGMVEPISGLVGALCVSWIESSLPYAMAFAAGAMIYVVFDDLIPEATSCGNAKLASWGAIFGFILMMCLDVGLG